MATNLNDVDNDGYLDIWYLEQLAYINTDDTTLGQKYELMRSLDFQDDEYYLDINNKVLWTEGLGWDPIGDFIFPYRQFKGSLNGNDFSIVNFFINRPTEQHIGLFAYIGNATIENLNMEDVSIIGNEATGALVGRVTGHNIMRKMYVSGNIKGVNHTGGIVGVNYDELLLNDIHSNVNINSTGNQVGGIVGLYYNSSSKFPMENLFVEGSITGVEDVGGIIGSNRGGISQANNLKSTAIVQGTINIGGVIGYSYQYTVEFINSGATGEIIGKNDSGRNIGGFIGQLIGGTIRECYSSANISNGYLSVGGFIGSIYSGTSNIIENSYATGDVNAESRVGGFLGYEYNNPLTLINVYAIGKVSGGISQGGLVGTSKETIVNNSYYDKNTTTQSSSAGGTGLTTAQMKQQSSYNTWDFDNIWAIDSNKNNGYPYLKIFEENME